MATAGPASTFGTGGDGGDGFLVVDGAGGTVGGAGLDWRLPRAARVEPALTAVKAVTAALVELEAGPQGTSYGNSTGGDGGDGTGAGSIGGNGESC